MYNIVYVLFSPSGQKFRSKVEIASYLRAENINLSIDDFDFGSSSTKKNKSGAANTAQKKPGRPKKLLDTPSSANFRKPGRPKKIHQESVHDESSQDSDTGKKSATKGNSAMQLSKKAASAMMRDDLKDSGRLRKRKETPEEREKRLGSMQSTKIGGMTIEDEIEKIISSEGNTSVVIKLDDLPQQNSTVLEDKSEMSSSALKQQKRKNDRHQADRSSDIQLEEMHELTRAVSLGLRGKSWTPKQIAEKVTEDTATKTRKTAAYVNKKAEDSKPKSAPKKSPLMKKSSFAKTARITKMRAVLNKKRQQLQYPTTKSHISSTSDNGPNQLDGEPNDQTSPVQFDDDIDIDDGFVPSIPLKGSANRKRKRPETADIDVVGLPEKKRIPATKKVMRKSSESSSKSLTTSVSSTQKSVLIRDADNARPFRRRKHSSGMFKDFVVDLPSNGSVDGVMFVTMPPYPDHAYCCLSIAESSAEDQGQGAWRSLSDDEDTMPAIPDGSVGSVSPGKSAFSWSPPGHHSLRFSPRATVNFEPSPLNHMSMWTGSSLGIMHSERPPSVLLEDDMPADRIDGTMVSELSATGHSHKRRLLSGPYNVASSS